MSLYKYLSDSCLDPLENGHYRFTQPNRFNDPFESSPHLTGLFGKVDIMDILRDTGDEDLNDSFKDGNKHFRLIPLSIKRKMFSYLIKYVPDILETRIKEIEKKITPEAQSLIPKILSEIIGIFCLTKNPNSLIMWSHYANNSKGVLMEFDEKHPFFSVSDIKTDNPDIDQYYGRPMPVMYRKNRPSFDYFEKSLPEIFFTKSIEWAYEEEYRMIMPLELADDVINENIFLFKIPLEAILSIRLGVNFDKSNRNDIIEKVKNYNPNIKVFNAHLSEKYYEIEFEEILKE